MLTSSEEEYIGEIPSTSSKILESFGLYLVDPETRPMLLVPEPIAFLLANGLWHKLVLRTKWHRTCAMPNGHTLASPVWQRLPGIDFPDLSAVVWENEGEYDDTLVVEDADPLCHQETLRVWLLREFDFLIFLIVKIP